MAPLSVRTLFCSATDTHDFFCNGIDEELGRHNSPVDHTNGQHLSLDLPERYDTRKYTVATRSLDDVPTTYASEVIRVERPAATATEDPRWRRGAVLRPGGDRRNDLPGILWHGFNRQQIA
ncbi:hypothetical protein JL721_13034 [Aureococcus anophagefferens]|nr:hypothetical protein JL721_13034 [Aureococcus anophagefferens]